MEPKIVDRPKMLMAGVVDCGKDVSEVNISRLWDIYGELEPKLPHRVDGAWYELHIGTELGEGIYSVMAGVELDQLGVLPIVASLKEIPAGKYAHFAHSMKEGGFGEAFARVNAWVEESGTKTLDYGLQLYDQDYDPESEGSVLHIYIPLAS